MNSDIAFYRLQTPIKTLYIVGAFTIAAISLTIEMANGVTNISLNDGIQIALDIGLILSAIAFLLQCCILGKKRLYVFSAYGWYIFDFVPYSQIERIEYEFVGPHNAVTVYQFGKKNPIIIDIKDYEPFIADVKARIESNLQTTENNNHKQQS